MTSPSAAPQRWLHGPAADLILGCGVGYALLVLLLLPSFSNELLTPWFVLLTLLLGFVTNTPHYGATLLRVYEQREDRRRYALFAVWITIGLWVLFPVALSSVWLGSLLLTIYVTWSPWHFAGQNYGLALMFLRRRGVQVTPGLKRLFYASFLLSFGLTLFTIHGSTPSLSLAPVPAWPGSVFEFLPIGIPQVAVTGALVVLGSAYGIVLAVVGVLLLRRASVRDLLPAALLVLTQALWFSIPALLQITGGFTSTNLALSTVWVAIAHSVQYLWVTSFYAKRAEHADRLPVFYGKALLSGMAIGAPALLFAPGVFGRLPHDAGLSILLFSMINLHHFLLDGAIWKLRDGRVARVLLRDITREPIGPGAHEKRRWLAPLVYGVGAVLLVVQLTSALEVEFGVRRALSRADLDRVDDAQRRLAWLGRGSAQIHLNTARRMAEVGAAHERILDQLIRSLELRPSAAAWTSVGNVHAAAGRSELALEAYRSALALEPEDFLALRRSGELLLQIGDRERARQALERAAAQAPNDPEIRKALDRLERSAPRSTTPRPADHQEEKDRL